MSVRCLSLLVTMLLSAFSVGCMPENVWVPTDGGAGGDSGITTAENFFDACTDGVDNDGDGLRDCVDPDCLPLSVCSSGNDSGQHPVPDSGDDAGMDECASVTVDAEPTSAPVDIIWVIDSSGSMTGEAAIVQDNMNAFATDISASGIDYHVVVMTDPAYVTVPPPLGTDAERYLFVEQSIGSNESLIELVDQFGGYSSFLRPDAVTHFVVVTDDESDMRPNVFLDAMNGLLGHEFTLHAIASEEAEHDCDTIPFIGTICDPGCSGPNGDAADIGHRYYELANTTGGEIFSICTADWTALFTTLREAVVVSAAIPCYYELPDPPEDQTFDSELVNVVFTNDSGSETVLARAMDSSRCGDAAAWYYDNNDAPTRIVLCEAACTLVSASSLGHVDVALGCEPDVVIY